MGIYYGERENPCPRCGGKVVTVFISVTPMQFHQQCVNCKTKEFTDKEHRKLGENISSGEYIK